MTESGTGSGTENGMMAVAAGTGRLRRRAYDLAMANVPNGPRTVKIEDRPLADPHLPKAARVALVVFCLAMVGAFVWAMGIIGWGVLHPLPWYLILLWFGYLGWIVWSDRRKETKRLRKAKASSEKKLPSENSN